MFMRTGIANIHNSGGKRTHFSLLVLQDDVQIYTIRAENKR